MYQVLTSQHYAGNLSTVQYRGEHLCIVKPPGTKLCFASTRPWVKPYVFYKMFGSIGVGYGLKTTEGEWTKDTYYTSECQKMLRKIHTDGAKYAWFQRAESPTKS